VFSTLALRKGGPPVHILGPVWPQAGGASMDRIRIVGGQRLTGMIPISGAKNATLPLMIASLLTEETLILENVPRLVDVIQLQRILGNHGVDVMIAGKRPGDDPNQGRTIHISAKHIVDTTAPYDLVSKMRASFWVVAPLVARMGEAKVSMPGGCAIGTRPVDLLIMALEKLGVEIEIEGGYVIARAKKGLRGGEIVFPKVTVGGTHTALMAASLANGTTVIENAAQEPEVGDVADCLNKMGAKISGAGTSRIVIEGVPKLHGARHAVLPDRIETGTYAMAVAMTGGDVLLQNARPELLQSALDVLVQTGTSVTPTNEGIHVARNGVGLAPVEVTTAPFPGFPTDLQAQLMALMSRADGTSHITETIFENRFMHVQELARLGARIQLDGETATIEGVDRLKGAPVMATDLRASVSLVIAALAAEGETMVNRVYHLDRGFERLEDKLARCGATIERISV
jgi:UDP-N-acetylglucosamine 1-carboxyvinyltransferase